VILGIAAAAAVVVTATVPAQPAVLQMILRPMRACGPMVTRILPSHSSLEAALMESLIFLQKILDLDVGTTSPINQEITWGKFQKTSQLVRCIIRDISLLAEGRLVSSCVSGLRV
jgi:hypothetical protein